MPNYLNITLRAVVSYFILLVLTRVMGKREVSQLTFFDYIVGITIGSITANMTLNISNSWADMLPALLIFGFLQIATSFISLRNVSFRKFTVGSPTVLIKDGKVLEENLAKERINLSELISILREKNAFKLADVETAILETDGKLSVQMKSQKQPVTPADLNMQVQQSGLPRLVIEDGNILSESLRDMGITMSWLVSKLAEQNIYDASKVMLAQIDTSGNLYIDLYEGDNKNPDEKGNDNIMM